LGIGYLILEGVDDIKVWGIEDFEGCGRGG
jgi:hypothetical protein